MSYTPTNWQNGDVITASGLNNMEQGISSNDTAIGDLEEAIPASASVADSTMSFKNSEGDTLFSVNVPGGGSGGTDENFCVTITVSGSTVTSDKTYAQIAAANTAGLFVYALIDGEEVPLSYIDIEDDAAVFEKTAFYEYDSTVERRTWRIGANSNVYFVETGTVPAAATATPQPLGTAAVGNSAKYARENHVHAMPKGSEINAASSADEVTVSTAGSVSQALDAGKIYHFTGAVTALTITLNQAAGIPQYHFDFLSGSTAATLTLPNTVTMPDSWAVEANKRYEIDILNGYGVVQEWGTT